MASALAVLVGAGVLLYLLVVLVGVGLLLSLPVISLTVGGAEQASRASWPDAPVALNGEA